MEFTESVTFNDLGLSEPVLKAIAEAGYKHPSPIQAQAIPMVLMCRDVLGLAQTGTGKTASFTLPMIDILAGGRAKARMPRSLILSPTRELAAQISENFTKYGKNHPLTQALIVGGSSMDEQVRNLDRGVDVLIATPGRLLDLFERGKILLADIKILVIDEADRMLDMGFIPDLEKIVSILPPLRQTLFFSATMTPEIKKLADKFLSNPKVVSVAPPSSMSVNVEHFIVPAQSFKQKQEMFYDLFRQEDVKNAFVFCNRKRDINEVARFMKSKGLSVSSLHGDMEQDQRTAALSAFKAGQTQLLVCSDVAARGLDIQGMSHVFNWDVPFNAEDYVHRTGRTGRAGAQGRAFTFATPDDAKSVSAIERLINKKITVFGSAPLSVEGAATATVVPEQSAPVVTEGQGDKEKRNRRSRGGRNRNKRRDENPQQSEKAAMPTTTAVPEKRERVEQGRPDKGRRDRAEVPRRDRHGREELPAEKNNGTFGDDVPFFLRKK